MKRKEIRIMLLMTVAMLFILSCRLTTSLNEVQPTYTPLPSYTPYPTYTPSVSSDSDREEILFQDDFSDPGSGWDQADWETGATEYSDGIFRLIVKTTQYDVWANPGRYFEGDVRVEADAYRFRGENDNDYGLICRYTGEPESASYYFGIISSDGYAVIGKSDQGSTAFLSSDQMAPADGIKSFFETNHLRFDCIGNTLTLYVNGNQIAEVEDSTFSAGDVGFIAGTFDISFAEIHFDNLVVTQP